MLLVFETYPIHYHAPVWRYLNQVLEIPVTVVYGSDFRVEGYRDKEFGILIAWDADLLEVYKSIFCLNHVLAVQKIDKENYNSFYLATHQQCVFHIIKRAKEIFEVAKGESVNFPRKVLALSRKGLMRKKVTGRDCWRWFVLALNLVTN